MAHAHQPMPGREEANADLRRVLADARQRELVEVVLDDVSVGDRGRLVHGVVVEPDDLPFDLTVCSRCTARSKAARRWASDRSEPSARSQCSGPGGESPPAPPPKLQRPKASSGGRLAPAPP